MKEQRVLMAYMDEANQREIETYEKNGGYQAVAKAIPGIAPAALIDMVKQSGLRGRGGAGFPTGSKWGFVPQTISPRYLVCNCDESEPGTFKDRLIIERDPHQLIEGIILASYAIGAEKAFIYCRGEFFEGLKILQKAVNQAKAKNRLGKLDIVVHPGAGAYIAGEETAHSTLWRGSEPPLA